MSDYIKYIPGVGFVDGMRRLINSDSTVLSDKFPQIQQGIDQVRGAAQNLKESTYISDNVPGLNQATDLVRGGLEAIGGTIRSVTGLKPPKAKGKSSLPSLRRGDDIPAALYPDGVTTGTGGGNAAQSVQPPTTPTGRDTPAPNGGSGTGTQMSPGAMTMDEANSLLTGGYKVANPFSSTQLPDTSGSPYFGKPDTPQYRSDVPEDTYDVPLSRNLTDGSPFVTGDYTYEVPTKTNIEYLQQAGSPIIPASGAIKATDSKETPVDPKNSGINWGARTAADNSDPNIARRRAFLDADSSLQGLRRIEGQKGIVVAGGQYNMVNPNAGEEGQNDFVKISKEDRDAYMGGRQTAEQMREKYMQKVADSQQEGGERFTSPPNWKMTPEVEPKTALTQRPSIEIDTSVLGSDVTFEAPDVIFSKGRDKYKK